MKMKINNLDDFITPKQAFGKIPDVADMSSYESPIRMIVGEMEAKMEADTMSVIHHYGIDVNKEELIKALNYDRGQYNKGFQAGYEKAKAEFERPQGKWIKVNNPDTHIWTGGLKCSECGRGCVQASMYFCSNCGAKMQIGGAEK